MTDELLNADEKARIAEAIRAAEARTAGEIYVVIAPAPSDFRHVPVVWAAAAALLLPWPLHLLTTLSTTTILILQVALFLAGSWMFSLPLIRYRLVPAAVAADRARRHALSQFLAQGVHLTQERTGILIYVALANRRVEVVADAVIHAKVGEAEWERLVRAITSAAANARLLDGLIEAVDRAGAVLAEHFPPRPDGSHLPSDHVIDLRVPLA